MRAILRLDMGVIQAGQVGVVGMTHLTLALHVGQSMRQWTPRCQIPAMEVIVVGTVVVEEGQAISVAVITVAVGVVGQAVVLPVGHLVVRLVVVEVMINKSDCCVMIKRKIQ